MAIPSLAMIPSGYKDGKVYSVLPSNGDGDFTFSRGSNATRVNKNGLIETMPLELGEELVTNGDFATDSDWIKGSGWSISGGEANCSGSGTGQVLYQQNIMPLGTKYKITVTVSSFVSGYLSAFGGDWDTEIIQSNGTFTRYTKSLSVNTGFVGNNFIGSIDNVSVKEVISGLDTPRLDYSDSSCPSLLLEPQRTNYLTQSNQFDTTWNLDNITISSNETGVGGSVDAWKLIPNTVNTSHRITNSISGTQNLAVTLSVYAKADGYNFLRISENGSTGDYATFNILDGIVESNTSSEAKIESVGNGWYRCSSSIIATTSHRFDMYVMQSATIQEPWSGDGTSGIYVFGAQVEEGGYATSYIPTSGSAVTRLGDECTNAGNDQVINSSEGVLYAEISTKTDDADKAISISDGSTNNRIWVGYSTINKRAYALGYSGSTLQFVFFKNLVNEEDMIKVACRYKQDDFSFWVDGVKEGEDTSGLTPIGMNELSFNIGTVSGSFYGNVKDVRVYNTALTDAELEELTTL